MGAGLGEHKEAEGGKRQAEEGAVAVEEAAPPAVAAAALSEPTTRVSEGPAG